MATCLETLRDDIIDSTSSEMKRALYDSNAAAKLVNDDIERSISEKMRNFENIIENLEKDKVRDGNPKSRGKKNEVKTSKVTTEATKNEQETENVSTANTDDHQSSSAKHKVVWVGTSLSKALDPIKLKKDLDVDLHMVKAYCIEPEGKFQESSFRAIVPKVVKEADNPYPFSL